MVQAIIEESGKGRRDCGVDALLDAVEDCREAGVPVYVKQDCAFKSGQQGRILDEIWKLKQFPNQIINLENRKQKSEISSEAGEKKIDELVARLEKTMGKKPS